MSERIVEHVTLEELRRITAKDRRTISDRIRDLPFQKKGNRKLYDKMLALQAIMSGKAPTDEQGAKERKAIADAEKAELIVARLRGELVPVADMKTAAAELVKSLYQRAVRVVPSILASKLIGRTDILDIEVVIRESYAEIFNELKLDIGSFLVTDEVIEDEPDAE
jgi:hypothetical protein